MTENYYMEIQEKISRLFDGELDDKQAEGLLNEVAENSELQALYLEQKTLHSYMQNPYMPETTGLKDGILSKIKLDTTSVRNYQIKKYVLRSTMAGLFLLAFGGAFLWFNGNRIAYTGTNSNGIQNTSGINSTNKSDNTEGNNNFESKRRIPVVSQANLDTKNNNSIAESQKSSNRKTKISSGSRKNYLANNTNINTELSSESKSVINSELSENTTNNLGTEIPERNLLSYSNLFSDTRVALEQNISLPKYYLNPVYNYKTALILDRLNLQFNWYGLSKSAPYFKPANSKTGILNDFSLFLTYDLTENTSVGVSFGYDNFLMQYEGWEGNTKFRYSQEYSTPWIGCNINYRFEPIFTFADFYEVSPFVQLNTAYANVGVYTQASVGIELGVSANTSILAGFNSGWLFYKYENYEFTNKNGLSIGLKYGF